MKWIMDAYKVDAKLTIVTGLGTLFIVGVIISVVIMALMGR